MSYRSVISDDRVMFFLSDTDVFELNSLDKVQKLVNASEGNLEQLVNEIKDNLIIFANEEIELMQGTENPLLTKTLAYAKLMQVVSHYFFQKERDRLNEQHRIEAEESNGDWSWTG